MKLLICFRSSVRDLNFSVQISVDAPKYSPYRLALLGERYINPQDIVSFSLTETQILNSGKLLNLKERIKEQGWKPIHLRDFELILLPNSKYTVGNGGNHRAYLSKELNVDSVPACVMVLVQEKDIPEYTYKKIKKTEKEINVLTNKLNSLYTSLEAKDPDSKMFKEIDNEVTLLEFKTFSKENLINQLLLLEARNLGYLSKELLEGVPSFVITKAQEKT